MAGRYAVPTALKIVRGNPGHRALPKDEPQPELGIPETPPDLDSMALAEWQRITPELDRMGVLAKIERSGLEAYCRWYSTWRRLMNDIQKPKLAAKVYTRKFIQATTASKEMRAFLVQYGLTSASRTKVSARPKKTTGFDDI